MLPDMDIGVVTLFTGSDSNYEFRVPLHEYLMDVALGFEPWINTSTICTFPDPWKADYLATHPSSDEVGTIGIQIPRKTRLHTADCELNHYYRN